MVEAQHVVCRHCLATNRVPAARLVDDPVCGRYSKALLDGETATLTDATFDLYTGKMELPIPTIVRLVNGRETARMSGAISANAIVSFAR